MIAVNLIKQASARQDYKKFRVALTASSQHVNFGSKAVVGL